MKSSNRINLPRDAEGREIPLDTKVLYDKDNKEHRILNYIFNTDTGNWIADFETEITSELHATEGFSLIPLDSWDKLLEDLDNVAKGGDNAECLYMRREDIEVGEQCSGCRLLYNADDVFRNCSLLAYADIAARIRKLAAKDGE